MDDKKKSQNWANYIIQYISEFLSFLEKSLNSSINFMTFKKNLRKNKLIYDIINIYLWDVTESTIAKIWIFKSKGTYGPPVSQILHLFECYLLQ